MKSLIIVLSILISAKTYSKQLWGFANVSYNFLNWSERTTEVTSKADFSYLELEGGAGFEWGQIYGFFDYENFANHATDTADSTQKGRRTAMKVIAQYKIWDNLHLYGHVYNFIEDEFGDQNRVMGLSYILNWKGLMFNPWIGIHDETKALRCCETDSGFNGYTAGWVALYNFKLWKQDFRVANWNEIEFDRNPNFGPSGEQVGWNGALSFWYTPIKEITTGVQYRYADQKLGSARFVHAWIFSLKYNFLQ